MKRILRSGLFALLVILSFNIQTVNAQEAEITDATLYNYALLDQVKSQMLADISLAVRSRIDAQDGFDGNRYAELESVKEDAVKLKAKGANEFEVKFMIILAELQEDRLSSIKEVINLLAKNMVGVSNYKAVKSALSSDAEVKTRYQAIASKLSPPADA
jgi:hypothetical protein